MKITSAGGTHVGNVRSNNEDNFYINGYYKENSHENIKAAEDDAERTFYTYAVCDGMGGESFGEIASLKALETLPEYDEIGLEEQMEEYVQDANGRICQEIQESGKRLGTTLALLSIAQGTATICNLGDSRIYQVRKGRLRQLTKDHTQVQQMVDAGVMDREQARESKKRHVLTQHIGIFPDEFILSPYIVTDLRVEPGDVFLLCSDGLTDMLEDEEILACVTAYQDEQPKVIVTKLVLKALEKGGRDNVTVIIVKAD